MFIYHDKLFVSYQDIINHALKLEGDEQARFVKAALASHEQAKANIGYFSGYYKDHEAIEICRIFGTEHPYFGKKTMSHREAYELGKKMGEHQRSQEKTK